jgi:hypothetical protein
MQKLRCVEDEDDPEGICETCKKVSGPQCHTLPCLRYKLTESTLYRTGKAPGLQFSARWPVMKMKDITRWESDEIRTIVVKADVSPVPFELRVKKFVKIPQDSLHRGWMDGNTKKYTETTTYAIADMRAAAKDMQAYTSKDENVTACIDDFIQNSPDIVRHTYRYALTYLRRLGTEGERTQLGKERRLLANYFLLWVAIRRTATVEHIVGPEFLDMQPVADRTSPFHGKVPLPPVMIQQLDIILTLQVLIPLRKSVLQDLQKLTQQNKPESWLTIYLVTFMTLHSCARFTDESYWNARKHGLRRRFSFPEFIADLHQGANVFLMHYHYLTESRNPFTTDWTRRHTSRFPNMTTEDIQFVLKTKQLVDERVSERDQNKKCNMYENELYFVDQMFEENWRPRDTKIDYDSGTIYGGPVRKFYLGGGGGGG